jgi:arginine/ornithine N-succinyltransferase beta subunit
MNQAACRGPAVSIELLLDHFRNSRWDELLAAQTVEIPRKDSSREEVSGWLLVLAARAKLGRLEECTDQIAALGTADDPLLPHAFGSFASSIVKSMQTDNPEHMRITFEHIAQRSDFLLELAEALEVVDGMAPQHTPVRFTYSTSSKRLWIAGLDALAEEIGDENTRRDADLRAAELLITSASRYAMGRLMGDHIWSLFDAVVAYSLAHKPHQAKTAASKITQDDNRRFREAALSVLNAYSLLDLKGLAEAWEGIYDIEHGPRNMKHYEPIYARLVADVVGLRRNHGYLHCRPAAEGDVDALLEVAREAGLPTIPPTQEAIQARVAKSMSTLGEHTDWEQGLLYLTATRCGHSHAATVGNSKIVGSSMIFIGSGDYWSLKVWHRYSKFYDRRFEYKALEFTPKEPDVTAIEFGGNAVIRQYQNNKVGRFMTECRVLFLLLHASDISDDEAKTKVYANLLTTSEAGGTYPFYELVVRPYLSGISYEAIDDDRYRGVAVLAAVLGRIGDKPCASVPLHVLPESVQKNLGTVRMETLGAERSLMRFGFRSHNKFDALDGGRYVEINLADLRRIAGYQRFVAVRADVDLSDPEAFLATFAPYDQDSGQFGCCRAFVKRDPNRPDLLHVEREACNALEFGHETEVAVFLTLPETDAQ